MAHSRKSTKKCSRSRTAVKSHRRGSRTIPALCRKKSKSRSRSRSKSRSSVKRSRSGSRKGSRSGARKVTIHKKDGSVVTFISRGRRRKTSRPPTAYQKFVSKFSKQHPEIPGGPKLIKAAAKAWGSRK